MVGCKQNKYGFVITRYFHNRPRFFSLSSNRRKKYIQGMKKFREQVAVYFSFTRKERTGIITLVVLILLICILPLLFPFFIRQKQYDHSRFAKEVAALDRQVSDSGANRYTGSAENEYRDPGAPITGSTRSAVPELFYFDPNTISVTGWKRLGLRDKTIQTIQRYLAKGGRFRKPEDIGKIWGLHPDAVDRLLPYVRMEENRVAVNPSMNTQTAYPAHNKPVFIKTLIDINTADTSAFIALPGIGSKLAARIVSFRDKLGGFVAVEQLKETFGLPDSTYQKIKERLHITQPAPRQLNVNTASLDDLKSHPYIRYAIANAIVQYRNQHGEFGTLEDLKKIMLITGDVYNKMLPYLTVH